MIERAELQLENRESIEDMIRQVRPCAILNAAGFASIERAESDRQRCFEANALGPENLAKAAKRAGIPLVTFSSDMVFDGTKDGPYVETDETRPLNAYGQSKAEGERRVAASGGQTLIIRSATFFSPHDAKNFAVRILDDLDKGATPPAANDCFMSPTFVPDLVDAALDLLIDGETGIWHLSNPACMSWEEFARELAEAAGFDPEAIVGMPARDLGWTAPRPSRTPLGSVRGKMLSEVEPAIARFLHDTRLAPHRRAPQSSASQRDPRVFPEMV
jgi:dTDP-4-dehydrorhamnose reductase